MVGGVRCSRIMNISDLRPAAGGVPEHGDDFLAHVLYARRVARGERVHTMRGSRNSMTRVSLEYARRAHSENRRVRACRLGRQRAAPRTALKRGPPGAVQRPPRQRRRGARQAVHGRQTGSEKRADPRKRKPEPHPGRRPRANARVRQTLNPDLNGILPGAAADVLGAHRRRAAPRVHENLLRGNRRRVQHLHVHRAARGARDVLAQ